MKDKYFYSKKDDKTIKRQVCDNIGNLQEAFRRAAIDIGGVSAKSVERRYYQHIRPEMYKHISLKRLIFNGGFFMISRNRIYRQGKNSEHSNFKPDWLKSETTDKLLENL